MLVSAVSSSIPVRGVRPVGESSRTRSNLGKTLSGSKPKGDSVELSGTAIAKSLKLQGLSQNQIASQMGLDLKTVDGYLGIAPATSYSAVPGTLLLQA
jgi:hypothetical protein